MKIPEQRIKLPFEYKMFLRDEKSGFIASAIEVFIWRWKSLSLLPIPLEYSQVINSPSVFWFSTFLHGYKTQT